MEINVGLVSVLVTGVVTLVVAVLGLLPNFGRMRRLERVVAVLEKTKDAPGRTRLLAVRDRIITELEPSATGARNTAFVGLLVSLAGYGLTVGAVISLSVAGGGEAPAPPWMWVWLASAIILFLVGSVVATRAMLRFRRLRGQRRTRTSDET